MKLFIRMLLAIFILASGLASLANRASASTSIVPVPPIWHPGFVIRAEDRFDPAIQRLMAEHSLRLLPLERGQLYYVYPIGITPRMEGMQIRYLETLLDKQAAREAEEQSTEDSNAAGK